MKLLPEPIVATGGAEPPALVDQAVVAPNHGRRPGRPQRTEAREAGLLEGALRLLGATAAGEFPAYALPIVTVEDDREMGPAVAPAELEANPVRDACRV